MRAATQQPEHSPRIGGILRLAENLLIDDHGGIGGEDNAIRKSHRADAQSALMDIASRQQQMLVDTRKYVATVAELNTSVPAKVGSHYSITITLGAGVAPAFTATATPQGSQAQDSCGTLPIDETGSKLPANCW